MEFIGMSPLVTPASSAATPVHPVKTSTLVSPVMLRNPGVSLVGRSVSKAFVDSESATGYAYCTGKVLGCREQDAFGLVYVVEFPDGDQDEMIYEELMLVLVEDELQTGRPIPRQVIEVVDGLLTKNAPDVPRKLEGVRRGTDHKNRDAYWACVSDETGTEHRFSYFFPTQYGAAAASDIMVRRLRAASGRDAASTPENFPHLPWVELVGLMLAGANKQHFNNTRTVSGQKRKTSMAIKAREPKKKKRRSKDEPYRNVKGNRLYDSVLGITCHWCRQKTVETHVSCTAEGCGGGGQAKRLPTTFCGMCLRNRHGESVDDALSSAGLPAARS